MPRFSTPPPAMSDTPAILLVPPGDVPPPDESTTQKIIAAINFFNQALTNDVKVKRAIRVMRNNKTAAEAGDADARDHFCLAYESLKTQLMEIAKTLGLSVFFTAGTAYFSYSCYTLMLTNTGATACAFGASCAVGCVATLFSGVAVILTIIALATTAITLIAQRDAVSSF